MRPPSRTRSLRARAVAVAVLAVVPALVATTAAALAQRRHAVADAAASIERILTAAVEREEWTIAGASPLLAAVGALPLVGPERCPMLRPELTAMLPQVGGVGLVGRDDRIRCFSPDGAAEAERGITAVTAAAIGTRRLAAGEVHLDAATRQPFVWVASPLPDASDAAVFARVDLSGLRSIRGLETLPAGSVLTLVDPEGTVLVRVPDDAGWVGRSVAGTPYFEALRVRNGGGTVVMRGLDGTERLYAAAELRDPSAGRVAYVLVGIPWAAATADADRLLRAGLLGVLFLGTLAMGVAWVGSDRFIAAPLERFSATLRGLAEGRESLRDASFRTDGLFGDLGAALEETAAALEARQQRIRESEAAARHSERLYRFLFEKNPHPMWVYDVDSLRFMAVNEIAVLQYGYSREQFLSMTIADIRPEEDVPELLSAVGRVRMGFTASGPWRHRRSDGTIIHVDIASHGMEFDGRMAELVLAVNVTERLHVEEALRRSEEHRRFALEAAGVGTWDWDLRSDTIHWSPEVPALHGLPVGAGVGSYADWRSLVHPADWPAVEERIQTAVDSAGEYRVEFRTVWPDGSIHWVATRGRVVADGAGQATTLTGIAWDVTDRKRGEEMLQLRAQEFQALAENSPDIVTRFDRDLRHLYINPAIRRYTGRDPADFIGRSNAELGMPGELLEQWNGLLRRAFEEDREQVGDFAFPGPEGMVHFQSRVVPEHGPGGGIDSVLCITRDITAAKLAEAALRQSEQRYRSLVEATAAIVWSAGPSGEIVAPQEDWSAFTGQPYEQIAGWGWIQAIHPDDRARTLRVWELALETSSLFVVEHRLWHHTGEFRHMSVRGVPLFDESGMVREWVGVHLDVTDRVRSAQVLAQQKAELQAIVRAFPDLYFWSDATGTILDFHAGRDIHLAMPPEEFLGKRPSDIFPEELAAVFVSAVQQAVSTRQLVPVEYSLPTLAGELEHFEARYIPLETDHVVTVIRDITERKRAEQERAAALTSERKARQEAEQASRAKSDFLAVISHELRTPLVGVVSFAEMLEAEVAGPLSERQREFVSTICTSAWHLSGLVDEILEFTRLEAGRTVVVAEPVDLAQLADEVAYEVAPRASAKGLALSSETPGTPLMAETDRGKVRQILLNLLANAVKFTERGEVRVRVEARAEGAELWVTDSGIGIPAEFHERIFEPFWQVENPLTRREGGTGLGLAIVHRLVRVLGGTIRMQSAPERGTTFVVTIPHTAPPVTEHPWMM